MPVGKAPAPRAPALQAYQRQAVPPGSPLEWAPVPHRATRYGQEKGPEDYWVRRRRAWSVVRSRRKGRFLPVALSESLGC